MSRSEFVLEKTFSQCAGVIRSCCCYVGLSHPDPSVVGKACINVHSLLLNCLYKVQVHGRNLLFAHANTHDLLTPAFAHCGNLKPSRVQTQVVTSASRKAKISDKGSDTECNQLKEVLLTVETKCKHLNIWLRVRVRK